MNGNDPERCFDQGEALMRTIDREPEAQGIPRALLMLILGIVIKNSRERLLGEDGQLPPLGPDSLLPGLSSENTSLVMHIITNYFAQQYGAAPYAIWSAALWACQALERE